MNLPSFRERVTGSPLHDRDRSGEYKNLSNSKDEEKWEEEGR